MTRAGSEIRRWAASLLLFLPILLVYGSHFLIEQPGVTGTGFIGYDQPYYMADARAYFDDSGGFHPTYGLPFSADPATPRIYFQPLTLALGIAWRVSGLPPGIVYVLAELVLGLACCRVALALYERVVLLDGPAAALGLICFFWGGGIVDVAGLLQGWVMGGDVLHHIFDFENTTGWWFLNFGRNLLVPTEAFYHLLFFGAVILTIDRRFGAAVGCVVLLAISHPFTGIQVVAVFVAWVGLERFGWWTEERPPSWLLPALIVTGALCAWYYLVYLPGASAEYRVLQAQWSVPWLFSDTDFLMTDLIVGALALAALIQQGRAGRRVDRGQRLLWVWFGVSLLLAKHDLFVRPVQPIHFAHDYLWTPLFLLGAPLLVRLTAFSLRSQNWRVPVVAAILAVFLFDNFAWFGVRLATEASGLKLWGDITLDADERGVLSALQSPGLQGALVLSTDAKLGYLATVYTPLRSWYSHVFNTPDARTHRDQLDRFFSRGVEVPAWKGRKLVAILNVSRQDMPYRILVQDGFVERASAGRFLVMVRAG